MDDLFGYDEVDDDNNINELIDDVNVYMNDIQNKFLRINQLPKSLEKIESYESLINYCYSIVSELEETKDKSEYINLLNQLAMIHLLHDEMKNPGDQKNMQQYTVNYKSEMNDDIIKNAELMIWKLHFTHYLDRFKVECEELMKLKNSKGKKKEYNEMKNLMYQKYKSVQEQFKDHKNDFIQQYYFEEAETTMTGTLKWLES